MTEGTSWIEIDRQRLSSNIGAFRSVLDPDCALMIVVKANAYGHGLSEVAPLVAGDAEWLGVNSLDEALALDGLGIEKPIAILGYTPESRAGEVVGHGFHQVVFRLDSAESLSKAARDAGRTAHGHIKVETGTHRLGVPVSELENFLGELGKLPSLRVEGMYTHFANIEDTLDPSFAELQLQRFRQALEITERAGIEPRLVHAAATAGVLLYPETHFSMVRIGIGAYGVWPSRETRVAARALSRREGARRPQRRPSSGGPGAERGVRPRLREAAGAAGDGGGVPGALMEARGNREISLQPVLSWKTRIAQIKDVAAGDFIGYGVTYEARRPMQVAVIPVGYYDGLDRKLSNSGRALVRGQTAPMVGRVAMNMAVLDVTATGATVGDEVVLIGEQDKAEIAVEELAEKTGTIPYEVLARIHPFLPRVVVTPM